MEPLSTLIRTGLVALDLPAEPYSVERWLRLTRLLERWNRQINLSGHRSLESIAQRLLLEAAAFCRVLPEAEHIADVGSGAGVPGLPIALCRPATRVLLIEARQRRHYFQRAAIRELGLDNVEPLLGRAETLAPQLCDGAVAQALKAPDEAVELLRPWVRPGGWIAIATTPTTAPPAASEGLKLLARRPYAAPGGGPERQAWIAHLAAPQAVPGEKPS